MEAPSNAVLEAKLEALANVINMNQQLSHEAHVAILVQTTKTNGRTTALEKARNIGVGMLLVMNILVIPVFIALAVKFIYYK